MKKLLMIKSIFVLSTFFYAVAEQNIKIDTRVLKFVDGAPILNKELGSIAQGLFKLLCIQQGGSHCAKDELLNIGDKSETINQLLQSDHLNQYKDVAVAQINDMVQNILKKHGEKLSKYKRSIAFVVEQWATQRNMHNSVLVTWCKTPDEIFFKQKLNSVQLFNQFIEEFHLFINDFKCTCPKSAKVFDAMWAKIQEVRAKKEL